MNNNILFCSISSQVVSLILSDIIGNQLDMIASGPTIQDNSTPQDCLDIIARLGATDSIPKPVLELFHEKVAAGMTDGSMPCDHVLNVCIGNNQLAVEEVKRCAEDMGFIVMLLSVELSGEASKLGDMFSKIAEYMYLLYQARLNPSDHHEDLKQLSQDLVTLGGLSVDTLEEIQTLTDTASKQRKPLCLIGAGETTVTVSGEGKGGRNQEMSLAVAVVMNSQSVFQKLVRNGYCVVFLSGGTDGQDGPTDAAGALADPHQVMLASQSGIIADTFLRNNDSYSFYRQVNDGKDLLVTGLTGTNVMDIQILLMIPPDPNM